MVASNVIFHFSLSNAASMSSDAMILFRSFSTVSYDGTINGYYGSDTIYIRDEIMDVRRTTIPK